MDRNFPRLLDTLAILQRTAHLSTTTIHARLEARGHDVNVRTLQRDLEDLARIYPIDCNRDSRPFTWCWRATAARIALPAMDWPEAISFHLVSTYLDGVLPASVKEGIQPYVDEARRKLALHFDDLPLRRWPERVRVISPGQPLLAPKTSSQVHLAVVEAVLLGRRLKIRYQGFDKKAAKPYIVSPLGLVQNGAAFHMPVRFDGHDDVRTITLHRVVSAEMLSDASGIEDFDLARWIDEGALGFGGSAMIEIKLRLFESAGELLVEAPLSKDQQIYLEAQGVHVVTATLTKTVQLTRWLLGLGPRVEVVAPPELRDELRSAVRAAADRYVDRAPSPSSDRSLPSGHGRRNATFRTAQPRSSRLSKS